MQTATAILLITLTDKITQETNKLK